MSASNVMARKPVGLKRLRPILILYKPIFSSIRLIIISLTSLFCFRLVLISPLAYRQVE